MEAEHITSRKNTTTWLDLGMCGQIDAIHLTCQLLPKACKAEMFHFQEIKRNEFSKLICHVHEPCP